MRFPPTQSPAGGPPPDPAGNTPVGGLADDLARDLLLHPVTDSFLRKCLLHFVGVLHPVHGTGGTLLFEMLATVSRAVLDGSMARFGQVNPDDPAVVCGGSPVRLLNYYRTMTPDHKFQAQVSLEGGGDKHGDAHDAWFKARNEEFEAQHLLVRRFLADATITTPAVMRALPMRLLAGLTDDQVRAVADEIAAGLTAQGFPVNLLTHSEVRAVTERVRAAAPGAAGGL